ncbi:MAG: LPS assembly lipoprotein LptE [Thermodesulfobacteriota bacterium]
MQKTGLVRSCLGIALLSCFLSGCLGYGFRGSVNNLPEDIKAISIPIFVNESIEAGAEVVFANALVYEFTRSRILQVAPEAEAQAVISGKIKSISEESVVYATQTQALERRVIVVLEVSCHRSDNQKVLWQNLYLSRYETFKASDDSYQNQRNKEEAIKKIAQDLSERIHNGILENF